ncbi:MAG: hypothetical protein WCO78_01505 [Candidatus Roizmanbacteria bacterium]
MRKPLAIFSILLYLFLSTRSIYAVPSPQQVEEAQTNSEMVVIGEVQDRQITGDAGTFNILISDAQGANGAVKSGDILVVDFRYVPENRLELGSSSVTVLNGDVIKIWLNRQENGHFGPSLSGNTIEYIKINQTAHIIQTFKEKIGDPIFQIGFLIVILVLVLTLYLIKRLRNSRQKHAA